LGVVEKSHLLAGLRFGGDRKMSDQGQPTLFFKAGLTWFLTRPAPSRRKRYN
jgi:hypothetical protein